MCLRVSMHTCLSTTPMETHIHGVYLVCTTPVGPFGNMSTDMSSSHDRHLSMCLCISANACGYLPHFARPPSQWRVSPGSDTGSPCVAGYSWEPWALLLTPKHWGPFEARRGSSLPQPSSSFVGVPFWPPSSMLRV